MRIQLYLLQIFNQLSHYSYRNISKLYNLEDLDKVLKVLISLE